MSAPSFLNEYDWMIFGSHPSLCWLAEELARLEERVLFIPMIQQSENRNWLPRGLQLPQELLELEPIQILTDHEVFRLYETSEAFDQEWLRVTGCLWNQETIANPAFSALVQGIGFLSRGHDFATSRLEDARQFKEKLLTIRYAKATSARQVETYMHTQLEQKGVHVARNHKLQRILLEGKRIKGLQFAGSSTMLGTQQAVLGINWDWVSSYFHPAFSSKVISSPLGWRFSVEFEMSQDLLPEGLTSKMIYAQAFAPAIEISRDGGALNQWKLTTVLPFHAVTLARDYQRKMAQRMFKVAQKVFPYLEYSLKNMKPNLKDIDFAETVDLVEMYPFRELSEVHPSLLVYGGEGVGVVSPIQGLYMAYGESYPKLGEWSSYFAAQKIMQDWNLKKPAKAQKKIPDQVYGNTLQL